MYPPETGAGSPSSLTPYARLEVVLFHGAGYSNYETALGGARSPLTARGAVGFPLGVFVELS